MSKRIFHFILIVLAAAGGWLAARQWPAHIHTAAAPPGGRKILHYQSPMHPWVTSPVAGNCTICGMKLVPIYEGEKPIEATAGIVSLPHESVTVLRVATVEVKEQPLTRTLRVAGMIDDDDSRHRRLSAAVEGRIEKLHVNYVGAEVSAGQPLASFYSPALNSARREFSLLAAREPSPERDRMVEAARGPLTRMGMTPSQIDALRDAKDGSTTVELHAPISGTVVERKVYEGQYVKEGDVLFEIADFSRMWFVFDAYERDLPWIRTGQQVEITTAALPGKVFTAPIVFIDPNLDPMTRTAKVRVVLENPETGDPRKHRHELLHKLFAEARVHIDTPAVLAIPRTAVLSPGGAPVVYVEKSAGAYEPRDVKLGRIGDELIEIVAGLKAGERVVTTGNLLIDAQAQLDRGIREQAVPPAAPRPAATPAWTFEKTTDPQRTAAAELLTATAALAEALAADNLAAFREKLDPLKPALAQFSAAFGEAAKPLAESGRILAAPDLPSARGQFYALSNAVADFAVAWRKAEPTAKVRVFECPMVKSALPDAPKDEGRWIQFTGGLRNPFFGAEMIECGEEVLP